jgi:hypothetical protein
VGLTKDASAPSSAPHPSLKASLPGTEAVRQVEAAIIEQLTTLGYVVTQEEFTACSHRLEAASVVGAGFVWVAPALVALFVLPIPGWIAALTGLVALSGVALLSLGVMRRVFGGWWAGLTAEAVNVSATRGEGNPRLWLVAHSDSKAQKVSLRGRVGAAVLLGIGTAGVVACLGARLFDALPAALVLPWVSLGVIGGLAIAGRPVRDGSPGAVDNASGVIAALTAAEYLRDRTDVGVLITGAEEFGMEGARQWIRGGNRRGAFVNFDGLDARGRFNVMAHRPGRREDATGGGIDGRSLEASVVAELRGGGFDVRTAALPLGIFVDGSVLASVGMCGLTLSSGDWSTLGVVHTDRDTPERTDVRYAAQAGLAVGSAAERLLG